jgi:hypothetical protein
MRKLILLFILIFSLPLFLTAGTLKDERKIEEEARQSLRPTEAPPYQNKRAVPERAPPLELAYFQELMQKKYVLRSDAIKPLLILMRLDSPVQEQAAGINLLKEKNILPADIAAVFSPDEPLRKGLAAYMFCRALGLKGGIWMRFFGRSQRYALKELAFEGIMPDGNINDLLSGKEFVAIFTHAAQFLARKEETMHRNRQK